MTPHQLILWSLDYKRILEKASAVLSEQTIRYANGLIEYLNAQMEVEQDCAACPPKGAPFHSDMVRDSVDTGELAHG